MRPTLVLAAVLAFVALTPSSAAAVTCRAPYHLAEITSATGLTCRQAVQDLSAYEDVYATSFRTPGGYTCRITRRATNESAFRCAAGSRSYRFEAYGRLPTAIRVFSRHYDKVFRVTACTGSDPLALSLKGYAAGGFTVAIAGGKLFVDGGDEQDGVNLEGTVAASRVAGDGTITADGLWTEGGLSGSHQLTGDCR